MREYNELFTSFISHEGQKLKRHNGHNHALGIIAHKRTFKTGHNERAP